MEQSDQPRFRGTCQGRYILPTTTCPGRRNGRQVLREHRRFPRQNWDGPDPENLSSETFDLIVETVRRIIDAVKPVRTAYALEPMPWAPPDSPDSYLVLMRAIDRKGFAVHLDPVNMINCPARAYRSSDFLRECFAKLGPHIRCCHIKDIRLTQELIVHLDHCCPGEGVLDFRVFSEGTRQAPSRYADAVGAPGLPPGIILPPQITSAKLPPKRGRSWYERFTGNHQSRGQHPPANRRAGGLADGRFTVKGQ